MKRIDVECGYRIEYPDGKKAYFGEYSGEGNMYKDSEAYDKGEGVCYISEVCLDDIEGKPMTETEAIEKGAYDYTNLQNDVAYYACDCETSRGERTRAENMDDFIKKATDSTFAALEWEEPDTRMAETDWDALYDEYLNGKW